MNELIKIEAHEISGASTQTCNARELWQFVESKQEFANWIKGRVEKYGFTEGEDFTVDKFINGRATVIDYHLTIEMAKELAMVENNEKGRQVRRYFIECERRAKSAPALNPASLSRLQLIELAMQAEQERLALEAKATALENKVAEQVTKVKALDRIATADGSLCFTDAAKTLQIRLKDLIAWLSSHKWIYQRPGTSWIAYQDKIQSGYIEHKTNTVERSDGTEKVVTQARITPKGLAKLAEYFGPGNDSMAVIAA